MQKYRFIDHTGDLGLEVIGGSLKSLFQHAGEAFADIVTDAEKIRRQQARHIALQADRVEDLLLRWLNEFVFLFDTEGILFAGFDIDAVDEQRIEATVYGETYDDARHPFKTAVKGATYHQLEVVRQDDGSWKARIIFDL